MSNATIEIEGHVIEVGSTAYCSWSADHGALVRDARDARRRLGHDVEQSLVLCLKCLRAIPLKI